MNVFADESIDRPIVDQLRQDGHNVIYVAELAPSISTMRFSPKQIARVRCF